MTGSQDAGDGAPDATTADPPGVPTDEAALFDTPLVELDLGVTPTVYAKVEWFNFYGTGALGSVKSRIGYSMIEAAEERGVLDPSTTIIEPSSGNTGAAVARVGAARGYDVEIVTPADAGTRKREIVEAAGAKLRLVPADVEYDAIIHRLEGIVEVARDDPDRPDYHWPNQYQNPANPRIHEATTGAEIREQTDDRPTHYVTGVGTGGTVSGVARALEGVDPAPEILAYEPASGESEIEGLRYLRTGDHPYQHAYEEARLDGKRYLTQDRSFKAARWLRDRYADREVRIHDPGQWDRDQVREGLRYDGAFAVGPSSGGNVSLVRELDAEDTFDADDVVVTMLCDRGDRYLGELWDDL